MPRPRNPNRDRAAEIWRANNGEITNRQIAEMLGESEKVVAVWKQRDAWSKVVQQTNESCTTNKKPSKPGAPKGNKNAVGNAGGHGGPRGNDKAVTHGFFRKYFPDDVQDLIQDVTSIGELDMLWVAIKTQFAAIIRAQQIMHVANAEDHSEFTVVHQLNSDGSEMTTKMIQPAWDKEANFLKAQSRAMKTFENLIARYLDLLPTSPSAEEHRLRIEKLRAEVARLNGDEGEHEDDGFLDALHAEAGEVWTDDDGDET